MLRPLYVPQSKSIIRGHPTHSIRVRLGLEIEYVAQPITPTALIIPHHLHENQWRRAEDGTRRGARVQTSYKRPPLLQEAHRRLLALSYVASRGIDLVEEGLKSLGERLLEESIRDLVAVALTMYYEWRRQRGGETTTRILVSRIVREYRRREPGWTRRLRRLVRELVEEAQRIACSAPERAGTT